MQVSFTNTNIIAPLKQTVWIDNQIRSDAYCIDISQGAATPTTATLVIPSLVWDNKGGLRGKAVRVTAGYDYQSTIFIGYISETAGQVSDNSVAVT